MAITKDVIHDILKSLNDPKSGKNLIEADMIRALEIADGKVRFVIEVADSAHAKLIEAVKEEATRKIEALSGSGSVFIALTSHRSADAPPNLKIGGHPKPQPQRIELAGVKKIIAVASGKGGVGKSTVAANLAAALAGEGAKTGILDADVYGPSLPKMLGISGRPSSPDGKNITPLEKHGVKLMSMGLMVKEDEAIIWRGPMLMGALQQMLGQVEWGELDFLIIDLPPGTGDVQLTLAQKTALDGAIIVSTPQDIALLDARKAIDMFQKTKTKIFGLVENMSVYLCPNCGHEAHIFGHGGAKTAAENLGLPFLGAIPLELTIREAGDNGLPVVLAAPKSPQANAFRSIAQNLMKI